MLADVQLLDKTIRGTGRPAEVRAAWTRLRAVVEMTAEEIECYCLAGEEGANKGPCVGCLARTALRAGAGGRA